MGTKFWEVEKQILLETHSNCLGDLINLKGAYLRQLTNSVLCGSISITVASKLLLNY